jgi:hypothetical protein
MLCSVYRGSERAVFDETRTRATAKSEYEGVSKSFRTGRLERELHMVQLSATRCSCIAILWLSLVSFATTTLCVASQRVGCRYFVIDSVLKLLDTPSYLITPWPKCTFQSAEVVLNISLLWRRNVLLLTFFDALTRRSHISFLHR